MAYSVLDLKNDLTNVLHGTTLNQVTNVNGIINRAARQLLLDLDPQETKRTVEFANPIFNSIFDYPIAPDVKGNKLIDIIPQVQRIPRDVWAQGYNQAFDVAKQNIFSLANMFTMNFNTGIKSIRINAPFLNPPVIINEIEAIGTNGTWATGGTASNLTVNNTNFVQGAGSLQFDITTGAGYIENSTMTAINLSAVVNQASLFINTFFPTASLTSSVELRFGSSSTSYYVLTVTQNQQSTAFQNGWNLEQFIWSSMTAVNAPNPASITYARITINTTGAQTGCLANGLDSILGSVLAYEYYSKYLFRNATTGTFQETVVLDSDQINLDTDSYNILFNQVGFLTAQQVQGLDAMFYDASFFKGAYDDGLARYKAMYKSELQKPQSSYYTVPDKSYSRYFGRFGSN